MYIGHYKAVASSNEFYAKGRTTLDYPTQIEFMKEKYSLYTTYILSGPKQEKNLKDRVTSLNIKVDIDIDSK